MEKTKAYGYVRVSGAAQVEKDGPRRQRDCMTKFMQVNNLEFAGWFQDLAVSGTTEGVNREGFGEMLSHCEAHNIRTIVVENLNRFARDLIVQEMLMRELRQRGIRLYSAELGFVDQVSDESDPGRTMVRQIFGAVAQYDKSSLVIKLRLARERVKRETGKCEGQKSYGNISARATSEAIVLRGREEKKILELITELREEHGSSYSNVAKLLSQSGFRNRVGNTKWDKSTVYKIYQQSRKNRLAAAKQKEKQDEHILPNGSVGLGSDIRRGGIGVEEAPAGVPESAGGT